MLKEVGAQQDTRRGVEGMDSHLGKIRRRLSKDELLCLRPVQNLTHRLAEDPLLLCFREKV